MLTLSFKKRELIRKMLTAGLSCIPRPLYNAGPPAWKCLCLYVSLANFLKSLMSSFCHFPQTQEAHFCLSPAIYYAPLF